MRPPRGVAANGEPHAHPAMQDPTPRAAPSESPPASTPAGRSRSRRPLVAAVVVLGLLGAAAVGWKLRYRVMALFEKQDVRDMNTRIAVRKKADPAAAATLAMAPAEDWPRWRGPRTDGISRETDLARSWPQGGPARVWEADVGMGYSSPVGVAGKVYLFSLDNRRETLTCFDAATGDIAWSDAAEQGWTGDYPGARAT